MILFAWYAETHKPILWQYNGTKVMDWQWTRNKDAADKLDRTMWQVIPLFVESNAAGQDTYRPEEDRNEQNTSRNTTLPATAAYEVDAAALVPDDTLTVPYTADGKLVLAGTLHTHCLWVQDSDGVWNANCGMTFEFNAGKPSDNGAKFCLGCGKPLIEDSFEEPVDEDE